ncbi:extracellular solute-binding protein [Leisingera aquaemixtae]|uniref:extracellular solute-binding protein n=1 Tax=Leisingera aquaemixtae TaxID=1396826 RepID=UPI001C95FCD6|nr:extracellular solute-binding protein [Leisingera aquaemixtae]MBY6069342.1 extracellular solute-binding protein [Leisingera aquaemixtae]
MSAKTGIRTLYRRALNTTAAACLLIGAAASQASADSQQVNITAWAEYFPREVLDSFEAETGISVVYDYFDSLEQLETKMLAGATNYDVVLPSALVANRLMQVGALAELDQEKLPNRGNLDPKIMEFLSRHDEDNRHGVPYLWGTTGVIYNPALIAERMENAPVESLRMIFDPDVVSKFADCGVAIIDSPEEIMAIALNYLGLNPFTSDKADFDKAYEMLAEVWPHVRHFKTASIINDLARGDLCLALGWSGDAGLAYARALEAGNGVEIAYSIPQEGTEVFFDFMSVPDDAPHPENAHAFINYMMKPDVIASVTNLYYYPNGNQASLEFVAPEIRNDPNVYPGPELMSKLFPNLPRDQKSLRLLNRAWTRFKTGR